jgi:hypothetical protein
LLLALLTELKGVNLFLDLRVIVESIPSASCSIALVTGILGKSFLGKTRMFHFGNNVLVVGELVFIIAFIESAISGIGGKIILNGKVRLIVGLIFIVVFNELALKGAVAEIILRDVSEFLSLILVIIVFVKSISNFSTLSLNEAIKLLNLGRKYIFLLNNFGPEHNTCLNELFTCDPLILLDNSAMRPADINLINFFLL